MSTKSIKLYKYFRKFYEKFYVLLGVLEGNK